MSDDISKVFSNGGKTYKFRKKGGLRRYPVANDVQLLLRIASLPPEESLPEALQHKVK
ncbi:hypothetical protein [Paenibacillus humicola]|uniref:hypothetical protein n=1 Tax=Paenibacillus humicola TaxID=3110540 RepID=UPI00237BE7D4|nr:hypothetical protein [Paenibacillus humicola]